MTETKLKKKKKTDFELLRKLEDEYDEAVDNLGNAEEILIKKVHSEYLKADNKGEFFDGLQKSESWYYTKFKEILNWEGRGSKNISTSMKEYHQERKKKQLIDDLEEMKESVMSTPVVEIDETLAEESGYVDPRNEKLDWIESQKAVIADTEAQEIVKSSNFGTYHETKSKIKKMRMLYKVDFKVSDEYRKILIYELEESIKYLSKLLEELK